MRLVRIDKALNEYGIIEGDKVIAFGSEGFYSYNLEEVKLLPPCLPTKAICVGLNYRDHIEEMGDKEPEEPTLFIKPSTAVIGPDDFIVIPKMSERVDYEGELAVVIGKRAKNVSEKDALDYVLGYTIANDVTARDLQAKDGQWTRAKSFDTFLPIGPWIVTDLDPSSLDIITYVNDKVKQKSNTRHLIFGVPKLVSFISHIMTLNPGDVILTGTPSGVGPLKPGDVVTIEIEGIGKLTNRVK
ncbi:fumarylacetoacetate hydrolase family protein [Thermoanaerobacter siderophilus]|uniref:2-keto-4-pentenoate hydratase/2-oxohepta-3-ene-1,7-dioic acid hydratase n=1 Tax=Thermoanaerobacter siderophilus SR4 TaxID=880478 RepID=I9KRD4_9THEO|nr:fumarylacetoacetate hydrolase family protein [Thermoanaerobacter siderophilus]EIV99355.1 2-keto-4-pentenoate hydratase/2-oxohepta-3-ene-1,7-dioic acid hydratase [Thermoanaerobacter siderophilus SR4]